MQQGILEKDADGANWYRGKKEQNINLVSLLAGSQF